MTSRIVIVEDDLLVARTIERKLGQAGYDVPAILSSGSEAVRTMPDLAPDLVLMDIELDDSMDGIEASAEIRSQLDVPIIYLTAYANEAILKRAKLTGPYGYLLKPFRDRELFSNIEITLHRHQLERALAAREAELSAILDATPTLMIVVDGAWQVRRANRAAQRAAGKTVTEMIGKRGGAALGCLHAQGDSPGCGLGPQCAHCPLCAAVRDTLETGRPHRQVEAALPMDMAGDRQERIMLISTSPLGDARDPLVLVSMDDVTDYRRTKDALRDSERRFQELVETIHEVFWVRDLQTEQLVYLSPSYEAVWGRSVQSAFESPGAFLDGVHPADRERVAADFARSLDSEEVTSEYRVLRPDGTVRWVWIRSQIVADEQGEPVRQIGIASDLTQRKEIAQSLRESEAKYRTLFQETVNPVLVIDSGGRYVDCNDAALRFLECTRQELLDKTVRDFFVPGQEQIIEHHEQLWETGGTVETDYYVNGQVKTLELTITPLVSRDQPLVFGLGRDITERKRAEAEQERLLAQMQQLIGAVPEGVLLIDNDGQVLMANPAAQRDLQILASTGNGHTLHDLGGYPLETVLTWSGEKAWQEIKAEGRIFEITARQVPEEIGWVLVIRDMSREREMQEHIRQQDRLAVIGQLAGGVAHDFNNLLTAIKGYNQFAIEELPPTDPILADLEEVRRAADRAASLTNQLLIFSRKQALQPRAIHLNMIIKEMEKMLRRLIGEDIALTVNLQDDLPPIMADAGQIEQVVMNLCVNARDAMPTGGRLAIETGLATVDGTAQETPGEYVVLKVVDTGTGMTQEVKDHLFEPFFTTKETGKGTGLGLSTIWGIVQQSEGWIEVDSEVGEGTTFCIYLPAVEQASTERAKQTQEAPSLRGTETVLLVEDEASTRALAQRALEHYGYTVLSASLPSEALRLSRQNGAEISLLITDVIMPEMSGRVLAQKLHTLLPDLRILYMSGYTDDEISVHGVLAPDVTLLEKPFTLQDLARQVREVLDA